MNAQEINALPDPLRQYIHDLETRCDPAGDIQTIASLREQIGALEEQIREARSNTGCALMQTVPSDDQIIMDRVRLAHKILEEAV